MRESHICKFSSYLLPLHLLKNLPWCLLDCNLLWGIGLFHLLVINGTSNTVDTWNISWILARRIEKKPFVIEFESIVLQVKVRFTFLYAFSFQGPTLILQDWDPGSSVGEWLIRVGVPWQGTEVGPEEEAVARWERDPTGPEIKKIWGSDTHSGRSHHHGWSQGKQEELPFNLLSYLYLKKQYLWFFFPLQDCFWHSFQL